MRDLRAVNRWLGGRRALFSAVDPYLRAADPAVPLDVLDVGTGAADLPLALARRARRLGRRVRVVAIDRDPVTVELARRHLAGCAEVTLLRCDAARLPFAPRSFDLVIASLFLHHFEGPEATELLRSWRALARAAVIVNDLRRHRVAWAAIGALARATRRSAIFLNDAPLSVLRGFTVGELLGLARASGARAARVRRRWPFRLVLTLDAAAGAP